MNFKKILACLSAMIISCNIVPSTAIYYAENTTIDEQYQLDGACGENATFHFEESTGILSIMGTGEISNYYNDEYGWEPYCDRIKEVIIKDGIVSIDCNTFFNLPILENVILPDSLNTIEVENFTDCPNLKSITLPPSLMRIISYEGGSCFGECYDEETNHTYYMDDFTIYGVENTFAELYAKKYDYNFVAIEDSRDESYYYNGSYGDEEHQNAISYSFDSATKTLTITGETSDGNYRVTPYDNGYPGSDYWYPWAKFASEIEHLNLSDGVQIIEDYAFMNCTSLKEVTIPYVQQCINSYAFGYTQDYSSDEQPTPIEGFTIRGYANSMAKDYAIKNGFNFVDISENEETVTTSSSKLTTIDIIRIKRYILGLTEDHFGLDFNGDGIVNSLDL